MLNKRERYPNELASNPRQLMELTNYQRFQVDDFGFHKKAPKHQQISSQDVWMPSYANLSKSVDMKRQSDPDIRQTSWKDNVDLLSLDVPRHDVKQRPRDKDAALWKNADDGKVRCDQRQQDKFSLDAPLNTAASSIGIKMKKGNMPFYSNVIKAQPEAQQAEDIDFFSSKVQQQLYNDSKKAPWAMNEQLDSGFVGAR